MRLLLATFRPVWSWWWGLGLLVVVPGLTLAVLGLRALRADRIEREQQARQRQIQVAHLADAALAAALAELEHEIRNAGDQRQQGGQSPSRFIRFWFTRDGLIVFGEDKLYFGEPGDRVRSSDSPLVWPPATEQLIEQVQAAEAQLRTSDAVALYQRIIAVDPRLKTWAELGLARLRHRKGEPLDQTLLGDPQWARSDAVSPTGLPVAILACAYIEQIPREGRARFTGLFQETLEGLRSGRWWLSYEARRFHDRELRRLIEVVRKGAAPGKDPRLEGLAAMAELIRQSTPYLPDRPTQKYGIVASGPILLEWVPSTRDADTWIGAGALGPSLADWLSDTLAPFLAGQGMTAAVRDGSGELLWGRVVEASHREALSVVPGWEIVLSNPAAEGWPDRQLLWYGLILMLIVMLVAGLAMTAAVVRREAELARLQNEFVAGVSHEFRSPITGIRLLTERLTGGRVQEAEASRYYSAIEREIDRLERHVDRLLEAQKIQEGKREYHFAPASLAGIVERTADDMRVDAEARGISLEVRIDDDIPEIQLDGAAIADALENLIDNAIKYSSAGTRVSIAVRSHDGDVSVEVSDEGTGIDRDELGRIFEKFYRGRRGDAQSVRGTGLGLALVKAAVEAHGGRVEVVSEPGAGSCFTMRLPVFEQPE